MYLFIIKDRNYERIHSVKEVNVPRKPTTEPTDVELQILEDLWEHGPSSLGEVHDRLGKARGTGYTTTQRMLNFMAEKGLLERDDSVRPALYQAKASKQKTQLGMVDRLLHRAFGGSVSKLIVQLLSSRKVTRKELDEVKRLIDEMERKKR